MAAVRMAVKMAIVFLCLYFVFVGTAKALDIDAESSVELLGNPKMPFIDYSDDALYTKDSFAPYSDCPADYSQKIFSIKDTHSDEGTIMKYCGMIYNFLASP